MVFNSPKQFIPRERIPQNWHREELSCIQSVTQIGKIWTGEAACTTLKPRNSLYILLLPSCTVSFFVCPLLVSVFLLDIKALELKDHHYPMWQHYSVPAGRQTRGAIGMIHQGCVSWQESSQHWIDLTVHTVLQYKQAQSFHA